MFSIFKPLIFSLDPEIAHDLAINSLKLNILPKNIFQVEVKNEIIYRMVRYQLAKKQSGNHSTKSISEISGTTKKPFKQKGTGSARQGSRRSPHMRGGSAMFGPRVRSHAHKLPKKIRSLALKMALSSKLKDGKLKIIDDFKGFIDSQKRKKTQDHSSRLDIIELKTEYLEEDYEKQLLEANNSIVEGNINIDDTTSGINHFKLFKQYL